MVYYKTLIVKIRTLFHSEDIPGDPETWYI